MLHRGCRAGLVAVVLGTALSGPLRAADLELPAGLRLVVSGQALGSYGSDDRGAFNASRSGYTAQRLFRLAVAAELRAGSRLSLLAEARTDNLKHAEASALYLRLRVLTALDLQAGRIPPLVGAFVRRYSSAEGPLIGTPLPYHYATSLRPDQLPPGPDALLRQRGYGAQSGAGGPYESLGLPLVEGSEWDTGLQGRWTAGPVELAAAYTRGSACQPVALHDDNEGGAWSGRLQWRPAFGLVLGLSAERGAYLSEAAAYGDRSPAPLASQRQTVTALDGEWAAGHLLLRLEILRSAWDAPTVRPGEPLVAWGAFAEARYKLAPGLEAGARAEHLGFDRLEGRRSSDTWDAPVWRLEAGISRRLRRNLSLAASYQHAWRDGGPRRSGGLLAARAVASF